MDASKNMSGLSYPLSTWGRCNFLNATEDLRLEIQPALKLNSVIGTLGAIVKVILDLITVQPYSLDAPPKFCPHQWGHRGNRLQN